MPPDPVTADIFKGRPRRLREPQHPRGPTSAAAASACLQSPLPTPLRATTAETGNTASTCPVELNDSSVSAWCQSPPRSPPGNGVASTSEKCREPQGRDPSASPCLCLSLWHSGFLSFLSCPGRLHDSLCGASSNKVSRRGRARTHPTISTKACSGLCRRKSMRSTWTGHRG